MIGEARRVAIVRLLRLLQPLDEHLPTPIRRSDVPAGFVNEPRSRSCPDCLANDRVSKHCETCGGSGVVNLARIGNVSLADELPDDDDRRDPYAINATPAQNRLGFDPGRHDAAHERDREIEALKRQTRPAPTEAQLLEEANRRGYAWEEERRALRRRFDLAPLERALDRLRLSDEDAYRALRAVYVVAWMPVVSPWVEQLCERGLVFLDGQLPEQLRAPGQPDHPAAARQRERRAAA